MNSLLDTPLIWVDQEDIFNNTLEALKKVQHIAVDTESNSLYAYQEQVCLIQISTPTEDYLIDGLAGLNLQALSSVFADENIKKIFHAAEYDIMCLKRDFGYSFNNLFDTMQSARILGFEKLGLSTLLEELFSIDQGKSFQKADWGKRPLPEGMLGYARMDTHFLFKLMNYLEPNLIKNDLLDLATEDFLRLCKIKPNHKDNPLYTQISGYHRLEPQQIRVLEELCIYRDEQAKTRNRPHFKIIGNPALYATALSCPKSITELKVIKEISQKLAARHAPGLLLAVKNGLISEPIHLATHKRPSRSYVNRLDKLKNWRKKAAKRMGVQSDIILPRDILENIAGKNPVNQDELHIEMAEIPWRFNHFSKEILEVIKQKD